MRVHGYVTEKKNLIVFGVHLCGKRERTDCQQTAQALSGDRSDFDAKEENPLW